MPYDEPEFDDPQELVGVVLPGDLETVREMASAFAEEFARLGFPQERIAALFREPHYAGPHQALLVLGPAEIARIVGEAVAQWGGFRVTTVDAPRVHLRVLNKTER
jgi:hypothetical protein